MARILGIDYGDRHLGLALSDPLQITAQPLGTYILKSEEIENQKYFRRLVEEKQVEEIVVGFPLRLDGTEGTRAELTRNFAAWLSKATGKKVILWDERWTTRQALRNLQGFKGNFKKKKQAEDQMAAVIILEAYLEKKRQQSDNESEDY
jgi:putative Holliday junction resolvase